MYALNNLNMTAELKTLFTSFTFRPLDEESAKISSDALKILVEINDTILGHRARLWKKNLT